MKLYQALKEKNKLAGEIKALEILLQQKNSRMKDETNLHDVAQLFLDLKEKRESLITLKTKISKSNHPIQEKIFRLAEYKADMAFFTRLSTKQGMQSNTRYGSTTEFVEYVAVMNEIQVLDITKKIQGHIDTLQEELDYFNHTTDLSE